MRSSRFIFCALLLAGCASGPDRVDAEFGNAARSNLAAQRAASPGPQWDGVGIDGGKAERAFRVYQGVKESRPPAPLQVELIQK